MHNFAPFITLVISFRPEQDLFHQEEREHGQKLLFLIEKCGREDIVPAVPGFNPGGAGASAALQAETIDSGSFSSHGSNESCEDEAIMEAGEEFPCGPGLVFHIALINNISTGSKMTVKVVQMSLYSVSKLEAARKELKVLILGRHSPPPKKKKKAAVIQFSLVIPEYAHSTLFLLSLPPLSLWI